MIRVLALSSLVILAACAESTATDETGQMAEDEARAVAATEFPGVDIDGLATCVRDNATAEELDALSLGGTLAQEATAAVLQRPEAQACVTDNDIRLPS